MPADSTPPSQSTPPARPRSRLRRLGRLGLWLAAIVAAIFLVGAIALRSSSVRAWLLAKVATQVETATGLRLEVGDWHVGLFRGELRAKDLELWTPSNGRLLAAPSVEAGLAWGSLLGLPFGGGPIRLEFLRIPSLDLDLRVELPPSGPEPSEPLRELPIRIDRLEIADGSIELPELGENAGGFFDRGRISSIRIEGEVLPEALDLRWIDSAITVEGERLGPPIEARASARLAGGLQQLRLTELEVAAPGLSVSGSGPLSLASDGDRELDLEIAADAAQLFPRLSPDGALEATAHIDLARGRISADIDARRFPAVILEPFLGAETFARLEGERTTLEATGTLRFDSEATTPIEANLQGQWIRGERPLFRVDVVTTGGGRNPAGEVDLMTLQGTASATADALPLEVLRPFLGGDRFRDLELAGSVLDLELDASAIPDGAEASEELRGSRLDTRLEATWRRGQTQLARGHAEAEIERIATPPEAQEAPNRGASTFRVGQARLELAAPDLAGGLVGAFLPDSLRERLQPDSTRIAVDLDLVLPPIARRGSGLEGQGSLAWRRNDLRLADLAITAQPAIGDSLSLNLRANALPDSPGARKVSGDLTWSSRLPAASDLLRGEISNGQLRIDINSIATFVDSLKVAFPELLGELEDQALLRDQGSLSLTATADGPLSGPQVELTSTWTPSFGPSVEASGAEATTAASAAVAARSPIVLHAQGSLADLSGEIDLDMTSFDLAWLQEIAPDVVDPELGISGFVTAQAKITGSLESYRGDLTLESPSIAFGDMDPLTAIAATLSTDGKLLRLSPLSFRWRGAGLRAAGEATLPDFASERPYPLPDLELDLEATDPFAGIQRIAATVRLTAGLVELETTDFVSDAGTGRVLARAPVARLREIEAIAQVVDLFRVPGQDEAGPLDPIRISFELPEVDTEKLLPVLGMEYQQDTSGTVTARRTQRLVANNVTGLVELVLDNWKAARGAVDIASLGLELDDQHFDADRPVELRLDNGNLTLRPARLSSDLDDLYLEVSGRATLARDWRISDPITELASLLDLNANGVIPSSQLNPFLEGGAAEGPLEVKIDLHAEGSLDRYQGTIEASGEQAVLLYAAPYETRIEAPEVRVTLDSNGGVLEKASGRLNNGTFELSGPLYGDQGLHLEADLAQIRYRLDYGLVALLSGNLALDVPNEGRGSLDGVLVLERGVVRKAIDLERELRGILLGIPDLTGTEQSISEDIDLDITLITYSGVKVKNNLADVTAIWTPLDIRGTLAEPLVEGKIEVDPGGFFYAYGQVFRLDAASIELSGLPGVPPKIEATTTSSVEDPSLLRRGGQDAFAASRQTSDTDASTAVAAGLADYYGGMLAEALTDSLGSLKVDIQPLLLFNESDPDARFTVSQDLNQYVALGVSINLRSAERRTYLLDFHGFDVVPGLSSQVFTNEDQQEGVTLQHGFDFGRGPSDSGIDPRIDKISVPEIDNISKRRMTAALDYKEGEDLPEGGLFDLEVAAADYLRSHGYPEARVEIASRPSTSKKSKDAQKATQKATQKAKETAGNGGTTRRRKPTIEIEATVHPGVYVTVEFTDDRPHTSAREAIRALYRPGFFEPAAIEAMTEETKKALRAEGYLEPEVTITTQIEDPNDPSSPRTVRIEGRGGRRLKLGEPTFVGVSTEDGDYLTARFVGAVARMELAAGLESADSRLLTSLRNLGFYDASIIGRTISEDGKKLTVELSTGEPRRIGDLVIEGLEPDQLAKWRPQLPIATGDRLRNDRVARAAYFLEQNLRRLGHADAKVRPIIGEVSSEPEAIGGTAAVTLRAEPGPVYKVDDLEIVGRRATRERWAKKLIGVEPDEILDEAELAKARRRLLGTGSFQAVSVETRRSPDGEADIVFDLEEQPRYRLAYGVRFESSDGFAVVADIRDRNLFGRGITVSARALEAGNERSTRLLGSVPRLFGSRLNLELLAENRELVEDGLLDRRAQSSVQLARPFGEHLTGRVYGRYRRTRLREVDPDPFFPFDETVNSPLVGVQVVFDDRVRSRLGRDGLFATIDVSGADQVIGSDLRYLRVFTQANYSKPVFRIGGEKVSWAQSLRLGAAKSFDDQVLIGDFLFLAGGEYSVRGYATESLGPAETLGSTILVLGGRSLVVMNQELRFPIFSRFSGVVFYDAGAVTDGLGQLTSGLFTSTGFGLRADTPLGLIRLDFAFPLDRRPQDDKLRFYIGLGQVF